MFAKNKLSLIVSGDDGRVGYLYLPDHPGPGTAGICVSQLRLLDLCDYKGPDIYLDFDKENKLIGIEIVG